ncbi:MAG: septum formation initiator family protein [Nitrospinota bacterium]
MKWLRKSSREGKRAGASEGEGRPRGRIGPRWGAGRWLLWGCVGASLLMVSAALFGREGILEVVAAQRRLESLREEMGRLRRENRRLRREIRSLRTDLAAIERIAREDLGLVRPGELVYEFLEGTPSPGERMYGGP